MSSKEAEKFGRGENGVRINGNLKFGFWQRQPLNLGLFGIGRSVSESRSIVEGLKWVASVKTSEKRNFGRLAKDLENSTTLEFVLNDVKRLKLRGIRDTVSKFKTKQIRILIFVFELFIKLKEIHLK